VSSRAVRKATSLMERLIFIVESFSQFVKFANC
jgi:hypothetical protein